MFLQLYNRGKNDLWRYILSIILVLIAFLILGQLPLTFKLIQANIEQNDGILNLAQLEQMAEKLDFETLGMSLNYGVILVLLPFLFGFITLWLCVKFMHKRSFKTLITTETSINWSKIFFAFFLWMGITTVMELIAYQINPGNYTYNFDSSQFWMLLFIAFTLLIIQTSFEELFMRGYLMQSIAAIAPFAWIPLLITSLIFGGMHLMNPEVGKFGFGIMMTYYIGTGLFLGIITLMDDSLELALGVHAATNIFGAVFVTFNSSALQTPALFKLTEVNIGLMLTMFIIGALLFFFICSRKYGWSNYKKLYGPLENQFL